METTYLDRNVNKSQTFTLMFHRLLIAKGAVIILEALCFLCAQDSYSWCDDGGHEYIPATCISPNAKRQERIEDGRSGSGPGTTAYSTRVAVP